MNSTAASIDTKPARWAASIVAALIVVWLGFSFIGEQRYYNTSLWQWWRPIVLRSDPQTAHPVEVLDAWRNALAVVETEKGLYFLSGTKNVPPEGSRVRVEANARWHLYLCQVDGSKCMTIHSFCAGSRWPNVARDAKGRAAGCYAPYVGSRSAQDLSTPPPAPARRAGPGRRFVALPPPVGISHPAEWAYLMGLPSPAHRIRPNAGS